MRLLDIILEMVASQMFLKGKSFAATLVDKTLKKQWPTTSTIHTTCMFPIRLQSWTLQAPETNQDLPIF